MAGIVRRSPLADHWRIFAASAPADRLLDGTNWLFPRDSRVAPALRFNPCASQS